MSISVEDRRLDEIFAALANSTRRAILARLTQGQASVNQLAEPFQLSLPAVSKHIKVLERAGLIVRSQHAQYRPCRLDPTPLHEVSSWTEYYRDAWERRLDQMQDYIAGLNEKDSIDA